MSCNDQTYFNNPPRQSGAQNFSQIQAFYLNDNLEINVASNFNPFDLFLFQQPKMKLGPSDINLAIRLLSGTNSTNPIKRTWHIGEDGQNWDYSERSDGPIYYLELYGADRSVQDCTSSYFRISKEKPVVSSSSVSTAPGSSATSAVGSTANSTSPTNSPTSSDTGGPLGLDKSTQVGLGVGIGLGVPLILILLFILCGPTRFRKFNLFTKHDVHNQNSPSLAVSGRTDVYPKQQATWRSQEHSYVPATAIRTHHELHGQQRPGELAAGYHGFAGPTVRHELPPY